MGEPMAGAGGGGGGGPAGAVWEEVPRYITRTKRLRMNRADFISQFGLGRNRTAAGAAALAAAGLGRYRVRRRMRRGGTSRMYRRYRGRGGFWSDLWGKTEGLRHRLGDMARASGNPYLQLAGQASRMLGTGAYEGTEGAAGGVVNNEIVDGGAGTVVPTFASASQAEMGTITLSHKEYVADVFAPNSAGVFNNTTYGINPGLATSFPWLSQIAANYDEYTIMQLIYTFRSTVTDFVSTNGQVGTVLIATQYNPNDTPFQSKQDMMEYVGAVSAKSSSQIIAGVECDPSQLSGAVGKYTRAGPTPPDEDIKTYDVGTLNVATANTPALFNGQAIGELWVSYTVQLRKPKFFVTRAQSLLTDVFLGSTPTTGGSAGTSFGTTKWAVGQQNRIGGALYQVYPGYTQLPGVLYYVFPNTFSGSVEVSLTVTTDGLNPVSPDILGPGPGASTGPPGIVPIKDIWVGNQWEWRINGNCSLGTQNSATTVRHLKIVSPTTANSAVPNVLVIGTSGGIVDFTFKVTAYNTGLNYSNVDRPIMSNPSTLQVVDFPSQVGFLP